MTTKELVSKYGYIKRELEKSGKRCVTVDPSVAKEDALRIANTFFKRKLDSLIIRKGYATKNGKKVYFKKKLTVIGEKPVWIIYKG